MSIEKLLGIKYPIIQGAMAQISRYELVSAVSNAGGLGVLASGGMSGEQLREEIRLCRTKTDKPFAVNIMLLMPNCAELIDVCIEENIKIITTGAGTPKPYMESLKVAGIQVIPVIPNVKIAKKMEELGAAAVIAEGMEAGGHIGETTSMALIPQVVDALSIPVIAAGGIASGRAIVAAYALGAQGVQMGTVFLASRQCPIPDVYKQKVIEAADTSTAVTGRKSGHPVRCLKNALTEEYFELENNNASLETLEKLTVGSLHRAVHEGDVNHGSLMAGQISGMIHEIKDVEDIILTLFQEVETVYQQLNNLREHA